MADRIIVMKNGRIIETGDADKIFTNPQTAYTSSLIEAIPHPDEGSSGSGAEPAPVHSVGRGRAQRGGRAAPLSRARTAPVAGPCPYPAPLATRGHSHSRRGHAPQSRTGRASLRSRSWGRPGRDPGRRHRPDPHRHGRTPSARAPAQSRRQPPADRDAPGRGRGADSRHHPSQRVADHAGRDPGPRAAARQGDAGDGGAARSAVPRTLARQGPRSETDDLRRRSAARRGHCREPGRAGRSPRQDPRRHLSRASGESGRWRNDSLRLRRQPGRVAQQPPLHRRNRGP